MSGSGFAARHHRARPRPFPNRGGAPRARRRSLAAAPRLRSRTAFPPSAARPGVRPPPGVAVAPEAAREELAVTGLDRLDLGGRQRHAQLASHRSCKDATAHANPSMDPPAVDRQVCLGQRALPCEYVGVDLSTSVPSRSKISAGMTRAHSGPVHRACVSARADRPAAVLLGERPRGNSRILGIAAVCRGHRWRGHDQSDRDPGG
jgi:hypothetical protein